MDISYKPIILLAYSGYWAKQLVTVLANVLLADEAAAKLAQA